jgi:hypothetical protein
MIVIMPTGNPVPGLRRETGGASDYEVYDNGVRDNLRESHGGLH